MLGPSPADALPPEAKAQYEAMASHYLEAATGQMAWVLEWFKEDLPLENKAGTALVEYTQDVLNSIYGPSSATSEHVREAIPLHAPQIPPPPPPKKINILVFEDKAGFCKGILENAPEGRIGTKKIVNWRDYGLEDANGEENLEIVGELIGPKGWDMILFGAALDTPKSNHVDDIIDHHTKLGKLGLAIVKYIITTENPTEKICALTRGAWTDEKELHKTVGLSLVTGSVFYGFWNTARQELENTLVHHIDTEFFLKPPFWDTNDYKLLPRLASEVFRESTFGNSCVRILNSGRYVARQVSCKPYAEGRGKPFEMPAPGDIVGIGGGNGALGILKGKWLLDQAEEMGIGGFEIQFLSRSMKISDLNMPVWKEVERKSALLDVKATQMRLDLGSQEAADGYVESTGGKLFGFIHSAGVLADSMVTNMDWDKFNRVWTPKHFAALWLHSAFERFPHKLKFFWNFSSVSAYGNMGQLNYSASNSYLDGFCRHRVAMGLPAQTFQWGAWGEAGMAASLDAANKRRMEQGPLPPFTNKEGLQGLVESLTSGLPNVAVQKANGPLWLLMMAGGQMDAYTTCFNSEAYPTLTKDAKPENAYEILRMAGWPYTANPNRDPLLWKVFIKPYLAEDDPYEYDEQAPGVPAGYLSSTA